MTSEDRVRQFLRSTPTDTTQASSEARVRQFLGTAPPDSTGSPLSAAVAQPSAPAEPPAPSGVDLSGLTRTALQGTTFGFGDELEAALAGLIPGGRTAGEAREVARQDIGAFRQAHPVAAFGAEVAGGLLTGGAGAARSAAAAAGRTGLRALAGSVGRQALRGGIEGAVAGAGAGEGVAGRTLGALGGGLLGAATGGTIQAGGTVLRRPAQRAKELTLAALERQGITDIPAALRRLGPGEMLLDLPGRTGAAGRVLGGAAAGAGAGAALAPEGARTEGALAGAALLGGARAATRGGTPIQRLARGAQSIPSEGSERITRALSERTAGAPTRILQTIQKRSKLNFEDATATIEQLSEGRFQAAQPLYREAFKFDVSDDVVRKLFDDPEFRQAYRRAQQIAARETSTRSALEAAGRDVPPNLADARPLPELFRVDEQGTVNFLTKSIPVRALDSMKKGLDAHIDTQIRKGVLDRTEARLLGQELDTFLSRVDDLVPEYRKARAAWAGPSRSMELFEAGRGGTANRQIRIGKQETRLRSFLNESPERINQILGKLSPDEQTFYRRGALDEVRARLERSADNRDLSKTLFGNTEMRRRLRALFQNDDEYRRFAEDMLRERRLAESGQFVLGGSQTARIQAEQAELTGGAGPRATEALGVALLPRLAAWRALHGAGARLGMRGGRRTVNELAPLLTATREQAPEVARTFEDLVRQVALRNALLQVPTAGLASGLGVTAGSAFAQPPNRQ